jgi:hypothetical protein
MRSGAAPKLWLETRRVHKKKTLHNASADRVDVKGMEFKEVDVPKIRVPEIHWDKKADRDCRMLAPRNR